MSDWPAHADAEDRALFERVEKDDPLAGVDQVTPEALRELAIDRGDDYATAAFFVRLRKSNDHAPTIRAVERNDGSSIGETPRIVIMPGAFHRHHKGTGASGARVIAEAAKLGWPAEVVIVGSLGSLQANAEALIEHLRNIRCGRVVVVSLSKGSADVAVALRHPAAAETFANVTGWLSLSGLTLGTPLVNWLQRQPWRMPGVHLLLWLKRLRFAQIAELRSDTNGPLAAPPPVPSHMRAIHVVGFPTRRHLHHPWAHRGYQRLFPLGPSDGGGVLLGEIERLPGSVYPVWATDHYLDPPWDFSSTLRGLLHAAASQAAASATPATRSMK